MPYLSSKSGVGITLLGEGDPDYVEHKLIIMRVKAYVLLALAFLGLAAGSKRTKSVEGVNPGDKAPRIEFLENRPDAGFPNSSGRYVLVNFWAAYDAESRADNVRMANAISKMDSSKIVLCSISLDKKESIFSETVKIDRLDEAYQFHENFGEDSEIFKKYRLDRGLRNFLIDGEGTVIACDVTPDRLSEILSRN